MNVNPDVCAVHQGFGEHPEIYAPDFKGHPGIDQKCGYGTPIHSPVNMLVYKVLTVNNPSRDGSGFTGVFGIVDDGIELYEYLIGHCDPSCSPGQYIAKGEVLGTEANHGFVMQDGVQITLAMQRAGDQRGSHRHCQKRPVRKVLHTDYRMRYLDNYSDWPAGSIHRDDQGFYYEIWNYDNGFHGCIDPAKSVFQRDLTIGSTGYDVFVLQRLLVKRGLATFAPTAYFGNLTAAAVQRLQRTLGILPDAGYFGPKTRTLVQQAYGI